MVRTGLDRLREDPSPLRGARVGLLVHPASVDRDLRPAHAVLLEAGIDLHAIFGPQHGLRGETQDNMVEWEGFTHPELGVPVFSLYGDTRRPTPEMLAGLDILLIDLQDVGARYYTFIWTMRLCLEACAAEGVRVLVADRPNPIGGRHREGPILDMAYESFVGMAPLPMRHGMTIGELAGMFRDLYAPDVDLTVVPMTGWTRDQDFAATGLPWVMPSPNMPTPDTALVYPGMCLLEGTTLSEGRGTTRPFEICGAPGVDPAALVARLEDAGLPGARFRALHFEPTFQKHAGQLCGGVQIHVTDAGAFRPVATAVHLLAAVRAIAPGALRWTDPPYEYETVKPPIDILAGGPALRDTIDAGGDIDALLAHWTAQAADFADSRKAHLLYD